MRSQAVSTDRRHRSCAHHADQLDAGSWCGGSAPLSGCASTAAPSTTVGETVTAGSTAVQAEVDTWISDLEAIDSGVRELHADPFAVVPEATWSARVAELEKAFPTLNDDERIVGMARLAGLLDTHTQFFTSPDQRQHDVLLYRFSDGLFVIAATDPSLVGARLLSINDVAADEVETARIRPLLPGDNESAKLNGMWMLTQVDYLHRAAASSTMSTGRAPRSPWRTGPNEPSISTPEDVDDCVEAQRLLGSLGGDQNEALQGGGASRSGLASMPPRGPSCCR